MAFKHLTSQKLLAVAQESPPPVYVRDPEFRVPTFDPEEFEEDDEHHSSIHLCINTPISIRGDNNLLAVDTNLSASRIAIAVVGALKQISMGEHAVPMIDGNGQLRSIKLDIRAETTIEGNRNVVGEKAILAATISSSAARKKAEMGVGIKRQRAMSEPLDGGGKRTRTT